MQIKDKVAIVTGGSNGIGAALCRKLSQEKARAVVVADIDIKGAQTLADEIGGLAVQCDVAREEEIFKLARQTEDHFGPVDLFFSNAGIMIQDCWKFPMLTGSVSGRSMSCPISMGLGP